MVASSYIYSKAGIDLYFTFDQPAAQDENQYSLHEDFLEAHPEFTQEGFSGTVRIGC